jgi:hypothetical protein
VNVTSQPRDGTHLSDGVEGSGGPSDPPPHAQSRLTREPGSVEAAGRSWFANCAWDAFGIGAALQADSTIHTQCADCGTPLDIAVRDGRPDDTDLVFHVLVPAASWWNDIGYT